MINTIIFDIGNVLAKFRWKEYLLELGFDENTRRQISEKIFMGSVWNEFDEGISEDEGLLEKCCRILPEYKEEIFKIYENVERIAEEYEYSEDWIIDLKKRGYQIYILSNFAKTSFEKSEFSFMKHVDGAIISYQERCTKPSPEIFHRLITKYKIVPENAIFFDDMEVNVEAAKKAGFHAFVFESKEDAELVLQLQRPES